MSVLLFAKSIGSQSFSFNLQYLHNFVMFWCRCPMSQKQAQFWTHFGLLFKNIVCFKNSIVKSLFVPLLYYINYSKTTSQNHFLKIIFIEIMLKGGHPSCWPLANIDRYTCKWIMVVLLFENYSQHFRCLFPL